MNCEMRNRQDGSDKGEGREMRAVGRARVRGMERGTLLKVEELRELAPVEVVAELEDGAVYEVKER